MRKEKGKQQFRKVRHINVIRFNSTLILNHQRFNAFPNTFTHMIFGASIGIHRIAFSRRIHHNFFYTFLLLSRCIYVCTQTLCMWIMDSIRCIGTLFIAFNLTWKLSTWTVFFFCCRRCRGCCCWLLDVFIFVCIVASLFLFLSSLVRESIQSN